MQQEVKETLIIPRCTVQLWKKKQYYSIIYPRHDGFPSIIFTFLERIHFNFLTLVRFHFLMIVEHVISQSNKPNLLIKARGMLLSQTHY